jgi:hypothetical protein
LRAGLAAMGANNCSGTPCCAKGPAGQDDLSTDKPTQYPGPNGLSDNKELFPAGPQATQGGSGANGDDETETYEDGSSYKGKLNNGRRHGHGTWSSSTETYCGQWKHDQRDGTGQQKWQDGRMYDGQFKEGKFHGQGRMEWNMKNGLMVYEGQYVDDLKDGKGKYTWPDGRAYDGEWKKGQRWGKAIYTNIEGRTREGLWKEDKVVSWLDGSDGNGCK